MSEHLEQAMETLAGATYEMVCSREESAQIDREIEQAKQVIRDRIAALEAALAEATTSHNLVLGDWLREKAKLEQALAERTRERDEWKARAALEASSGVKLTSERAEDRAAIQALWQRILVGQDPCAEAIRKEHAAAIARAEKKG